MKKLIILILMGLLGLTYLVATLVKPEEKVVTVLQTYSNYKTPEDAILPYRVEQEVVETFLSNPKVEVVDPETYPTGGISWLISLTSEGTPAYQYDTYEITYNSNDEVISKSFVPFSTWIKESTPKTYSYGSLVKKGAYFTCKNATSYGVDCKGCGGEDDGYGGTSAGIQMSTTAVRQSDGSWVDGITYDGYYIVATDKAIPLCTIVEISNHKWSGQGLEPGVTFKAVVLDRGGAIKGTDIDLYTGSEANPTVKNGKRSGLRVEIIGFAKWTKNSQGQRICKF